MQSNTTKQILFLILFAVVLVLLMGVIVKKNVHSQTIQSVNSLTSFSNWDWNNDEDNWDAGDPSSWVVRYNRVEGLFSGYSIKKEYWEKRYPQKAFLYGFSGYSFSAKEVEYQLGLEKGFFNNFRFGFGGEYHRMIDTPDRWIMPEFENSLAAFFLKEDFNDYYFREGGSFYITQKFTTYAHLKLSYEYDILDSLKKNTDWALFGGKKHFRENPLMTPGEMDCIRAKFVIDTRMNEADNQQGWYVQIEGVKAGSGMGGDFNFDHLVLDLRRFQPLGYDEGLNFRLRMGTANGELPWQYRFYLGGVSTMRGFPFKSMPSGPMSLGGNRMFLAQLEYNIGKDTFPDDFNLGFLDLFNVIVFADVGWIGNVDPETNLFGGFDGLSMSTLKNDVGIALANRDGSVRLEIARRTDTGRKPFNILFRINKAF